MPTYRRKYIFALKTIHVRICSEQIYPQKKVIIMNTKKFWTLRYTIINMMYFAAFCTIHAYANAILTDRGFSTTQIGLMLAIANIVAVFGQPIVAGIVDKSKVITNRRVIILCSLILLAGSTLLLIIKDSKITIFIIYAIIYSLQFVFQPLMIAMNFEYQALGCKINFGLSRGMGSAGFAFTALFLGMWVNNAADSAGVIRYIPYVSIVVLSIMAIVTFFFKLPENVSDETLKSSLEDEGTPTNNIIAFIRKYPKYMLFLLGGACCFFAHNLINDFMIQIINNLNIDEAHLGYSNFFQAILELPMMAISGILLKKFNIKITLIFTSVAFFVKTLIMYFAVGISGLYISQSFQFFAYALFIPAAAYYSDKVMEKYDMVKGQALISCFITISAVFSSIVGGRILDSYEGYEGVSPMLFTGLIVAGIGVIITILSMIGKTPKTQKE